MKVSTPGRIGYSLPEMDVPEVDLQHLLPEGYLREEEAELPEVSELDIMRHYTAFQEETMGWIPDFIHWVLVR